MSKTLAQLSQDCQDLDSQFTNKWNIETRLVNLMEEVGELSHDVLVVEGKKNDALKAKDMGLNLTNLLYEILLIADKYSVSMDDSWEEFLQVMPQWVEMRNKK